MNYYICYYFHEIKGSYTISYYHLKKQNKNIYWLGGVASHIYQTITYYFVFSPLIYYVAPPTSTNRIRFTAACSLHKTLLAIVSGMVLTLYLKITGRETPRSPLRVSVNLHIKNFLFEPFKSQEDNSTYMISIYNLSKMKVWIKLFQLTN